MIIVESGKIVEFCAEAGEFVYDNSTEPSIFCGSLGESIKQSFAQVGKRFTFGGEPGKDQRVYYFNTKEITGNKFGTSSPVPFRVTIDESMNYKLSVDLRCNGVYSYKIADPVMFYTNVSGNVEYVYSRSEIDEMLKSELLDALRPAFAQISAMKIMYSEIPAHTKEVTKALSEELKAEWKEKRGIELFTVSINGVSIPENQNYRVGGKHYDNQPEYCGGAHCRRTDRRYENSCGKRRRNGCNGRIFRDEYGAERRRHECRQSFCDGSAATAASTTGTAASSGRLEL